MDWFTVIGPGLVGLVGGLIGSGVVLWTSQRKIKADIASQAKAHDNTLMLQAQNFEREIEKIRLNLEAENAKDLRKRRIDSYKELWAIVPEWFEQIGTEDHLKNGSLHNLRKKLSDWYFQNGGGLILTDTTNAAFLKIVEDLRQYIFAYEEAEYNDGMSSGLSHNLKIFTDIKDKLEELRTMLAKDTGTRKDLTPPSTLTS